MGTGDRDTDVYTVRKYDIHLLEQLNEEYRSKPLQSVFPQYDRESQFDIAEKRLRHLSELVHLNGRRVLEVGCGRGYLARALVDRYDCSVVGTDIREHAEWQALTEPPSLEYMAVDLSESNPFAEGSFDLIVSFVAWEHMMHPFAMLKECCRILKPQAKIYIHANLYRSPRASHLYRDIHFPFPHLLFSEEVIAEFCLRHGVDKHWFDEYYYRNKLTYSQYKEYFAVLNLGVEYEQLHKTRLDADFYERFKDKLGKYPRSDLELDFFEVLLVKGYGGLPEVDYVKRALTMEREARRKEGEESKARLNTIKSELNTARAQLNTYKKETTRLQTELAKEKRKTQAVRDSLSFRLGSALVRPVARPGRFAIRLAYRLLRRSPEWLKRHLLGAANRNKILGSLAAFGALAADYPGVRRGGLAEGSVSGVAERETVQELSTEPDLSDQRNILSSYLERFRDVVLSRQGYPLVVISSTTKRIGEANRANRCMMFATELAAAGVPVIYVYYRFKGAREFADYSGGYLLQMPNDLFHAFAGSISGWDHQGDKLFLCSIPDVHSVPEVGLFRYHGWKVVYEVRDDWEEFHKAGVGKWYDPAYERFLCKQADCVTAVSCILRDKMISLGAHPDRTFIVPNGLTRAFLEGSGPTFTRRRSGYRGDGTIGYFGHLTENWFNWKLLCKVASRRKDRRFEIVGFGAPKDLKTPSNVVLLGEKTHDEIIDIASRWSAAMIPFKNSRLAEGVDPIKIYEYLALGLPCVSCWMPQIEEYPLVFTYRDDSRFGKTLDEAISYAPSEDDWDRVQSFVEASTWDRRVKMTLALAGVSFPGLETDG